MGGDTALWLILVGVCLVVLALATWRQARPPRCPECRRALLPTGGRTVNDSPPVMETTYRCPGCHRRVTVRTVAAWD